MTSTSGDGPAPGWYPDPHDRDQQRYWDGDAWTEHRHPARAESSTDPEDTAVLPRTEQTTSRSEERPATSRSSRGGSGWVPALVGLLVGLIVGGTAAAVVVGNNDDSSSPQSDASSATSSPPSTATATATATESVTSTVTATATVTVTESPSP